jgi:1-deoxy-D-xylulose-5-phosphate reductoisomerase
MKKMAILGSTGSIGVNTLEVVRQFPEEFEVCSLAAAGTDLALLRDQIKEFRPLLVAVRDQERVQALREMLTAERIEVVSGVEGLIQAATVAGVELVVLSVVGAIGIHPLLAAIEAGTNVALANKEAIVTAGEIVMKKVKDNGVAILPIDSEHSAIFQALGSKLTGEGIRRIVLTASGGPFYTVPAEALIKVSPQQALAHPVWDMGRKISVDSATMMNKGLEVIEAHWLFHVATERIEVAIHPQGVVHSLVEYVDGSLIAQLSIPDMRIPISYALAYPKRLAIELPALDLAQLNHLTFDPPDDRKFPCLRLAYEALAQGGTMPAVLNAANEAAVGAFLEERICFGQIPQVVAATMDAHHATPLRGIEDALAADQWAKGRALDVIQGVSP